MLRKEAGIGRRLRDWARFGRSLILGRNDRLSEPLSRRRGIRPQTQSRVRSATSPDAGGFAAAAGLGKAWPTVRVSTIHAESELLVPSIIVVASTEPEGQIASPDDPRGFQLKERVTASDVANAHFSSQLIERIGWALADAERAEREEHGQLEE